MKAPGCFFTCMKNRNRDLHFADQQRHEARATPADIAYILRARHMIFKVSSRISLCNSIQYVVTGSIADVA